MQPGTRLNHYEVVAPLGEGGMGRVYRAQDTRLKRQVAIKVLPPEVAGDPDRLARLEREAQVLAQLEHANVAGVYGLEETVLQGRTERFLVMQLAEGETLADRLAAGPLPLDEAVSIARQVALGLEAAHARGIVHRDLKPANVMLGSSGEVKLLDFGLAKAMGSDEGRGFSTDLTASPTVMAATALGVIMGTAPYMSPEQARGKTVDRRTDLWALGCLLYEMLTAKRTFDGETATDVIASVVQREPDWSALPAASPPAIRRLLARCLAKDPDDRLRDAGDAALLLREALGAGGVHETTTAAPAAASPVARLLPWVVAVLALAAALAAWSTRSGSPDTVGAGPARFSISLPDNAGVPVLDYGGSSSLAGLALSADGSRLAFVGHDGTEGSLWIQAIGEFGATQLPSTLDAIAPFFSPDGSEIGFLSGGSLWRIALPGGVPVAVGSASGFAEGATWTDDDRMVFTRSYADPLSIVAASGGEPRELTRLNAEAGEASHRWPHALPGGRGVLFVVKTTTMESLDQGRIAVADLDTGEHHLVLDGGTRPAYLDSGHLVFARDGGLYAAPFDLETLEVTGAPVQVFEGLITSPPTGNAFYATTRSGALAYIAGDSMIELRRVARLVPGVAPEPLPLPDSNYVVGDLAPGGRRLLLGRAAANDKLWVADLATNSLTRLVGGPGNDQPGQFSPDGRWVIFASDRLGGLIRLHRVPVDGSSPPVPLLEDAGWGMVGRVSRDAGLLGYESWSSEVARDSDAYLLPIGPAGALAGEPRLVAGGVGNQSQVAPSPDGALVAYTSTEAGDTAVYVVALASGDRVRLTRSTSSNALWSGDGRLLYYQSDRTIYRTALQSAAPPTFGESESVAEIRDYSSYALAEDGRSLLVALTESGLVRRREVRVDLTWGESVARATAPRR